MTGATNISGTGYPSEAPVLIRIVSGFRLAQSLAFSVVFCRLLFVLVIVVYVFRFALYVFWYLQTFFETLLIVHVSVLTESGHSVRLYCS